MFEHVLYRIRQIWEVSITFGIIATIRALRDIYRGEDNTANIVRRDPVLRYKLNLRSTFSDMWGYIDIFKHLTYVLPSELESKLNGQLVIDIGGYNGASAVYFASRYPKSTVVVIEPNRENFAVLLQNIKAYGKQIKPINAAAAPTKQKIGSIQMGSGNNKMMNVYLSGSEDTNEMDNVAVISPKEILDMVGGKSIGLLKIDIEGAEKALFESTAISPLLRRTGVLLVETHDQLIPGASEAVARVAAKCGLSRSNLNPHTEMYLNHTFSSYQDSSA